MARAILNLGVEGEAGDHCSCLVELVVGAKTHSFEVEVVMSSGEEVIQLLGVMVVRLVVVAARLVVLEELLEVTFQSYLGEEVMSLEVSVD